MTILQAIFSLLTGVYITLNKFHSGITYLEPWWGKDHPSCWALGRADTCCYL